MYNLPKDSSIINAELKFIFNDEPEQLNDKVHHCLSVPTSEICAKAVASSVIQVIIVLNNNNNNSTYKLYTCNYAIKSNYHTKTVAIIMVALFQIILLQDLTQAQTYCSITALAILGIKTHML